MSKNIKSFDQYLSERFQEEQFPEVFPDEFFDVIGDSKATRLLVSLTRTVKTDSPETTGWSVHDSLMKDMLGAIEGNEAFTFAGDSFNRNEDEDGGFTIVANIKMFYNVPADDEGIDLESLFRGLPDVDVEITEI